MTRAFLVFGKQEHANMGTLIQAALATWARQWFGEGQVSVDCTPAILDTSEQMEWWYAKPATGWGVFIKNTPDLTRQLVLALFGDLPKSGRQDELLTPLVKDCITDAITDLAACTLHAITDSKDHPHPTLLAQAPTEAHPETGNGAIHAQLHFSGISLPMIIPGSLAETALRGDKVQKSAAASTPLTDPITMILNKPISLTAILGQAQIDIGTLQSIAIGDVIRVQTRIDQPATLATREGITLCQGYVGSRNNYKSLQLHR